MILGYAACMLTYRMKWFKAKGPQAVRLRQRKHELVRRYGIPENMETGLPALLEIFDVRGQRVKVFEVDRNPGWHETAWNGRSDNGDLQPSGHYILRLSAGGNVSTWKMTMVK